MDTTVESPWPGNFSIDRKRLINSLVRGRELTTQLQTILCNRLGHEDGSLSTEDLLPRILRSFTEAISALKSADSGEVCQNPSSTNVSSPSCDGPRTEDSGESRKSPAVKDRRGDYKRRKVSETWTKITPTPIDDGRAWRKYGQKVILNCKYPRNYYRCTHKNDQGCAATKQVQQIEDDPPKYRTIYKGQHTCKDISKPPQFIMDSTHTDSSSFVLSFQSDSDAPITNQQQLQEHHPFFSSSFPPIIKQECQEEIPNHEMEELTHNQQSSSQYFLPSVPTSALPSTPGSDHGDVISGVYSCSTSSHSLDMSFVGDFDDVFHFDDDDFFPV
ncbi:PREDICTED: probable WRKY transcription factor 70 [Nelumbo nucifera]|nr:PREDICTED: probable WRKY transcription factor 70 [Nelumbo nucifera]